MGDDRMRAGVSPGVAADIPRIDVRNVGVGAIGFNI
jgi:hypothetical protein